MDSVAESAESAESAKKVARTDFLEVGGICGIWLGWHAESETESAESDQKVA